MTINIFHRLKEGPWGGGHQFLKALKKELVRLGCYQENSELADVVLLNSFEDTSSLFRFKRKYSSKIFIHRVDGPIFLVRGRDKILDKKVFRINQAVADGTVFQSKWCLDKSKDLGMPKNEFETVIYNAPDRNIFNRSDKKTLDRKRKIKLVAVSWSDNWKKGFEYYQFLDDNLNFSRWEFVFVGRSPVKFKNIKIVSPLPPEKLAALLKEQDIYVTASQNEPCSNALIEALACGLPSLVLESGGHPELIGKGGVLLKNKEEMVKGLEKIVQNYKTYADNSPIFSIEKVAQEYLDFGLSIAAAVKSGNYLPKKPSWLESLNLSVIKIKELFGRVLKKI